MSLRLWNKKSNISVKKFIDDIQTKLYNAILSWKEFIEIDFELLNCEINDFDEWAFIEPSDSMSSGPLQLINIDSEHYKWLTNKEKIYLKFVQSYIDELKEVWYNVTLYGRYRTAVYLELSWGSGKKSWESNG